MTLKLSLTINDIDGVEKAELLLSLFKQHWMRAEQVVANKVAESTSTASVEPATTLEGVREALETVVDKRGMSDGLEILKSYGAAKLSDLPQDRYADFVTVCQEAAA